jgi:hypothetical protein
MRKGFTHYESLWEVKKQLSPEQYVAFDRAVCEVQFLEKHIDDIKFDDPVLNLLWTSIKHTLRASIEGYCNKTGIDYDSYFKNGKKDLNKGNEEEDKTPSQAQNTTPCQGGYDTPSEGATDTPCRQETEKETETEEEKETEKGQYSLSRQQPQSDFDEFVRLWNETAEKYNLAKIKEITPKRKRKLALRLKENGNFLEDFKLALKEIGLSEFLQGKKGSGWKIDFDFLIKNDTNCVRVAEGQYRDKKDLSKYRKFGLSVDEKEYVDAQIVEGA